jgi:NAD(P)H-dependent FMN reductase
MARIGIISSSVRIGKKSDRVALFFKNYINIHQLGEAELVDLAQYDFPIFKERLYLLKDPPKALIAFSDLIKSFDGIVLVSPEYNGGYPASLKNVIDVLQEEWKRKPIGISTVSSGPFGGMNLITSLQYTLWKMGAFTIPAMFPVANVENSFDGDGNAIDKEPTEKRASIFLAELLRSINLVE